MQKFLVFFVWVAIIIASCNCGTIHHLHPAAESIPVPDKLHDISSREGKRIRNRELVNHMSVRTVSVRTDCSPKDGIVFVGVKNPNNRHDGRGTGIIVRSYKKKSYIFTAAHVIKIKPKSERKHFTCKITVQLNKDAPGKANKLKAKIIASDDVRDIAILEVDADLGVSTELELNPFTGEDVWAVGYPTQKASPRTVILSVTKGTLATKNVPVFGNSSNYGYFHRVTSQVYFGNSGGGIWTKEGKLTGIVVVLYAGGNKAKVPYEGYYYAKPVNEVIKLLKQRWKYDTVFKAL